MSQMIPFNQGQAPAFLQQMGMTPEQVAAMNAGAAIGTGGGGVNRISLKQSRFRLIVGGTETMIIPTLNLQLVVVRANDGVTKTWFEKEWSGKEEDAGPPDCSSDDGIVPRLDSPKRQANACAECPMNEWGSKINKINGNKIKACTDGKTMAIVAPDAGGRFANGGDLYQLKTPPASLGEFGAFAKGLNSLPQPVPYNAVVTEVSFDPQASYPKLLFKPIRYLEADEYQAISSRFNDPETKRVAGMADVQVMREPRQQLAAPVQQPQQQAPQQQFVQPQQQAPQQQFVQPQQAPVQQPAPQQGGWGATPVADAPAPGANSGWGSPAQPQQQTAPQVFQQAPQADSSAGWGQQAPPQQAPQQAPQQGGWGEPAPQQAPQQQAPQQQFVQPSHPPAQTGVVLMAGGREYGKPSGGGKRRTKVEIAEDDAYMAAQGGGQQQAPQQQAAEGFATVASPPLAQQAPVANGWGEPAPQQQPAQQAPQQQAPAFSQDNPFAGAGQAPAQGAPNQPLANGLPSGMPVFAGWDN